MARPSHARAWTFRQASSPPTAPRSTPAGLLDRRRTTAAGPLDRELLLRRFVAPSDSRLWRLLALLRRGVAAGVLQRGHGHRAMVPFGDGAPHGARVDAFAMAGRRSRSASLVAAKRAAFSDRDIGAICGLPERAVRDRRHALGLRPGFAMVDTCAAEFAAETPYFYATYAASGSDPEAPPVERPAAVVIGSGPVRIGQGIEFDYCAVQAAQTLRAAGYAAVMVNSNPETVSTDFDASSRLYFEPLDAESVLEVIDCGDAGRPEAPLPALVQFGGQTPLNLAAALADGGRAASRPGRRGHRSTEERTRFAALVDELGIPQPEGGMATSLEEALAVAERVGYPGAGAAVLRHRRPGHRLLLRAG